MGESPFRKKTSDELKRITDEVVKRILEDDEIIVKEIILYGSYARGTADEGSDIDIMVLCDNDSEKTDELASEVFRLADKVGFENDILIQTNVKNESFFNAWVEDLPYYRNVRNEGIVLYG